MLRRSLLVLIVCLAQNASAGGLSLPEPNAAALGRAGTATAIPEGPSSIYYNPAGLAFGRGLTLEAGIGAEYDRTSVDGAGTVTHTATTSATPNIFVSQRLGDHVGVGLGFYRAPTQTLDYADSFVGRFRVQRASFGGNTLTPAVAGRPFSFLSIGFGLNITFADLELAQSFGSTFYESRRTFQATAVGIGGSLGVWLRVYRQYLSIGASYRSAMDLDHSGHVTTTLPGSTTPLAVEDARLTLPMPHLFTFAAGSHPHRTTSLQLEVRLGLLRDLHGYTLKDTADPPTTVIAIPLSLQDLVQIRLGGETHLVHDHLALRLGIGYDFGSARRNLDPSFPDGDRVIVSGGVGFRRRDFSVDAGYMGSFTPSNAGSRGYAYAADYSSIRHTVAVSLTVHVLDFGTQPKRFD